jgi:hypothetical protein
MRDPSQVNQELHQVNLEPVGSALPLMHQARRHQKPYQKVLTKSLQVKIQKIKII